MKILLNILVSGLAVFVAARLLPGVTVAGFGTAIAVAVVLGIVSAFLAPALLLLTLPLNIMTLGLFTFVIIGGLVMLTARMVPGFQVASFWWALAFALLLSVINAIFHGVRLP
ncbi:MAG: phage holin family protein [Elusimicrobiota bacterium]|nr:phage holin family protein [Elusimicrobiota bacterium]